MEKIIHSLISNWIKGVDTYTHNGSTWLIFTDSRKWVVELTESKTLWYNYNFFKQIFEFTSLDVVGNQQYITKWVEDNIINKVKDIRLEINITEGEVDDIIQDGVKETKSNNFIVSQFLCEEVIDKGVKETKISPAHTEYGDWLDGDERLDEIIKNGVKHTEKSLQIDGSCVIEDTVQNGVRHTEIGWHQCNNVDDAIEYGVKETHDDAHNHKDRIEGVIENGVKVTLFNQGHKRLTVKNIIENGVRHTFDTEFMPKSIVEDIIQSGVKETKGHGFEQQNIIDDIVKDGVKETNSWDESIVGELNQNGLIEEIIENGIKETKTPGNGDIRSTIEWMEENKYDSYTKMIDDVIENGEKINGTYTGGQRQSEKCKSVVEYGTKNPTV